MYVVTKNGYTIIAPSAIVMGRFFAECREKGYNCAVNHFALKIR